MKRQASLHAFNAYKTPVSLSLALVLGLEMSSRTNFESFALALRVKSLALALKVKSLALRVVLGFDLEQKSLALAKQVLGLAGLVICQTNNTATMLKNKKHFHHMNDSTVNSQSVLMFSFYQTYYRYILCFC